MIFADLSLWACTGNAVVLGLDGLDLLLKCRASPLIDGLEFFRGGAKPVQGIFFVRPYMEGFVIDVCLHHYDGQKKNTG